MSKRRDPNNLQFELFSSDDDVKDLFDPLATNYLPNLKKLHIYQNKVTDKGIEYIASAISKQGSTLENFGLSNQKITKEGIKSLSKALESPYCSLKALHLEFFKMSDFAKIITEGLIKNTSLVYLNLSHSNLGDEGAIYLASALENNKNIKGLQIILCAINKIGGIALANVCAFNFNIRKVSITSNNVEITDFINSFEKNWCFEELGIAHNKKYSTQKILHDIQYKRVATIKEIIKKIKEHEINTFNSEEIFKMSSLLKLPFSKLKNIYCLSDKDLFTLENFFNSKSFFLPKAFVCKGIPESDLGFFNQIPNELFENIFQYVSFFDLKMNLYTTEYMDNYHGISPIGEINISENI